jgi:hypothetical protein
MCEQHVFGLTLLRLIGWVLFEEDGMGGYDGSDSLRHTAVYLEFEVAAKNSGGVERSVDNRG